MQFDLVETAGMTEDQLREIPYTVVETHLTKQRNQSSNSVKVHKNHGKDRVDRIRGWVLWFSSLILHWKIVNKTFFNSLTNQI